VSAGTAWLAGAAEKGQVDGRGDPSQAGGAAPQTPANRNTDLLPERPGWMDEAAYEALLDLQRRLQA
jgi:hypothetical protein